MRHFSILQVCQHRVSVARISPLFGLLLVGGLLLRPAVAEVDFDTQVRPLLSDNCFQCHGPDEAQRQADLRLDTLEGALADLGGYSAFVPGDVEQSEALQRILSSDPDLQMPPPDSNLKLSENEKKVLVDWVKSGAEWSQHWAYAPPIDPPVPADASGWSRGPIDRFIMSQARAAGLKPRGEADRETLIRRLSLDLIGLPPSPDEVAAFESDPAPDAYERVVDRLLASPHYGERMAWEWLDAARYADTDGFQGDPTRTMWPWRDWLIDALNANMPFDQFTHEMLAGDLLPEASPEQILATGFNRNHMFNGEGGRIAEETRVENVFDRAETTATVWLGLTLTCCRCHDHKFDPISQKEYYQFYAFFNNTSEDGRSGRGKTAPVVSHLPPQLRAERADWMVRLHEIEDQLAAPHSTLDEQQRAWEEQLSSELKEFEGASELGSWWQLGPLELAGRQAFDDDLGPEKDLDLEAAYQGQPWQERPQLEDGKVQPLPDTLGATYLFRRIRSPGERMLHVSLGSDDAIKVWINGEELLSRYVTRAAEPDQEMLDLPLQAGENELLIKIVNVGGISGFFFRSLGESMLGLSGEMVRAIQTPIENRSPKQQKIIRDHYRQENWSQWQQLASQRDAARKRIEQFDQQAESSMVMVMDDLPESKRRETYVLERGDYQKPSDLVTADTPGFLPPLPAEDSPDRLALAEWIVSSSNPLTARVLVNRYWQTFFGRGLVASSEDFGSQGTRPSHPQLLDWLALRFMESGWDVKQMHKRIVMSATYRQSSVADSAAWEADPENIWLARAPRFRLPSWILRDQALAAGGLLVSELGGAPVKPYQPEGIWAEATFGKIKYAPDNGQALYRRSIYVFWRRIVGPTMFFDEAKRQTCEVKPTRTNTPLHALTTWNETTYVESARAMAQRVIRISDDPAERLTEAFRLTTGRSPHPGEIEILLKRVTLLMQDFGDQLQDAEALLQEGDSERDLAIESAEHAAYTLLCSLLLNLDESLTRR